MIIEPVIKGVVAKTAHPYGCEQAVLQQINYVKQARPIIDGPKRVLIIGGSSGFGLATRTALTFGGAKADTISVSFERGPSEKGAGSAGFYNNIAFKKYAQKEGRLAINIQGDAFSEPVKAEVIEAIETYFEGEVDLIVYSVASGVRPNPETGELWRSAIKPIDKDISGVTIMLEDDTWQKSELKAASAEEADQTIKVMGGEDWESWVDHLINSESIANGCKTIAFSYMGPELTHPIYLDGTLGRAKIDLHQTSHSLNLKLSNFSGGAYATVCKALVTKASVFIPGLSPYIIALYKVMKEKGTHEGCIEQMQRLFRDKLYSSDTVPVDCERLVRMDEWELDGATQIAVNDLVNRLTAENFTSLADYHGFKQDFLNLNGFGFHNINYSDDVDIDMFINKTD